MSIQKLRVPVVILGGGLTGLSAALHLRDQDYVVLEKEAYIGGLAVTDQFDGFLFDRGSHIWFTGNPGAESFVQSLPNVGLKTHTRSAWVHIYGRLVPAPFQANLHGLPLSVISDCLIGYVEAERNERKTYSNFADWLQGAFGEGIYKHFLLPYNTKVWTVPPDELATDWQQTRVDVPAPRQLIDGAIGLSVNSVGANSTFSYPENGGIGTIASAIAAECRNITCGIQIGACTISTARLVVLADGTQLRYDKLISTIPLPALVRLTQNADLSDASARLRSTQLVLVNIALRNRPKHDYHWIYFAERKYPFFRVSFLHNYSDHMCPNGAGSIQAECAFSSQTAVNIQKIAELAQARLVEAGYLDPSEVLFVNCKLVKPAYVLCDHNRRSVLDKLFSYLEGFGVCCCGRFGSWDYLNMDKCIVAGRDAAEWAIR